MRRGATAVIAVLLTGALTLAGGVSAQADDVPFDPIVPTDYIDGAVDSLAFLPGEGIVATGWVVDKRNPGATAYLGEAQILFPDGHAQWWSHQGTRDGIPRPDVASVYPAAGPNHGYRAVFGFPNQVGVYKLCLRSNFEVVGCGSVRVTAASITGVIESLTVDTSQPTPALRLRGWVSDTWAVGDARITVGEWHTDSDPAYSSTRFSERLARVDRPDIRAAHPELTGIQGFDERLEITRPGDYRVCVRAEPRWAYPMNLPGELGCVSLAVVGMSRLSPGAVTGTAHPGSTLSFTPPTWSPTPTSNRVWWLNPGASGTPIREGALDYPVTLADVGRRLTAVQAVSAPGVLGSVDYTSSPIVTLPGVSTSRLGGVDRFAVVVANAKAQFPDAAAGAPVVYIASGITFPDALSAGPAAAKAGGALLLTLPDRIPAPVEAEIRRLHPRSIVVVGGRAAVGDAVLRTLSTIAPTERIGGPDRYAVSRGVVEHAFSSGSQKAFIVTGANFPDALSASAAAGAVGAPVLLVDGSARAADAASRSSLAALGVAEAVVVGGSAAVSDAVAGSLGPGITVTRLAGPDRYSAAVALNRARFAEADTVYLAVGTGFADGLSVGARAGSSGAPLYLSNGSCVPQAVLAEIQRLGASSVVIVGGAFTMRPELDLLYACT